MKSSLKINIYLFQYYWNFIEAWPKFQAHFIAQTLIHKSSNYALDLHLCKSYSLQDETSQLSSCILPHHTPYSESSTLKWLWNLITPLDNLFKSWLHF